MNLLNNLSLRAKLLLVVIPILIGLGYFAYNFADDSYQTSEQMNLLNETVSISLDLGGLAHEIQKERGNSSGYLSSSGQQFGEPLRAQRDLTDNQMTVIESTISKHRQSVLLPYSEAVNDLENLLQDIAMLRMQVDNLELTPNEAITEYTKINTLALSIVESFGGNLNNVDMFSQSTAYTNFLKSKERAGIERALGTQGFVLGQLPDASFVWFTNLVAEQNAYTDAYLRSSEESAISFYTNTMNIPAVGEVDRMRQKLFRNQQLDEDPQYWFGQITQKINALKAVEDYLAQNI